MRHMHLTPLCCTCHFRSALQALATLCGQSVVTLSFTWFPMQAEVSALQEKLEAARDDYGSLLLYNLELKRQIANRLPSGAVRSIEQRLINEGGMERVMLLHQAAIGPGAAANNKEYVQLQASPFDRMPGVMPGASSGAVIQPQYNTVQAGASSGGLQATSQGWAASLQGGGLSRGAQPLQAAAGANQVCGQHIATLSQGLIVGMDGVGLVLQQPQQQPLQAAQPIQSTLLAGATSAIQPGLIMQGAIRPSGQLPSTQQLAMAQQRVHLHRQILLQDHHGLPVDKKPE